MTDAMEHEQVDAVEAAENLYHEEPTEAVPTVPELQEKQRQEDREFPERMAKLQEQVEQKAQQFQQQAQDDDESAPRWSDADLRDLNTYARAQQNQQARAQQWQAKVAQAMQEAGAADLRELREKAPKVALQLKDDYERLTQGAQAIQQAAQTIQTNLTVREVEAAREKLFRQEPDLKDDSFREGFIEWGTKQGWTREQIEAERNPEAIKLALKAYRAETRNTPRPKTGKIPKKKGKADTKQAKSSVPKEIRKTAIGQKMLALENMYGPPAKKSAPPKPKLPSRHPVNILYGESV